MINIQGVQQNLQAAQILKQQILEIWPDLETHKEDKILIHSGANMPAGKVEDVDLILIGLFKKPREIEPSWIKQTKEEAENLKKIKVNSFCIAIECKNKDASMIRIKGTQVYVKNNFFGKANHNATEQNNNQRYALLESLKKEGIKGVFVSRSVFLTHNTLSQFKGRNNIQHLAQLSDSSFADMLQRTMLLRPILFTNTEKTEALVAARATWEDENYYLKMVEKIFYSDLFTTFEPTAIDRRKMESIKQLRAEDKHRKKWLDDIGKKQIVLRGRGGTGKTVLMFHMAYKKCIEEGKRSLILTYNKTLIAEMKRLRMLLQIGSGDEGLQINSVMSFIYRIWRECCEDHPLFLEKYDENLDEIMNLIKNDKHKFEEHILRLMEKRPEYFDFNYVFIDEGQDWRQKEVEILRSIYGHKNIIVAHGIAQLTRDFLDMKTREVNWEKNVPVQEYQLHPLKRALRMKSKLADFVIGLNEELGGYPLDMEPNSSRKGGNVLVIEGDYFKDNDINEKILINSNKLGNENIDSLFCCSHKVKKKINPVEKLRNFDYEVWDGSDEEDKKSFPRSNDVLRFVLFEGCRGLEGWSVVNLGFDDLWEQIYEKELERAKSYSTDPEGEALITARNWLLIPATRAIDTLVLQIESKESKIGKHLYSMKEKGFIDDWIKA
tara:strand:+ start:261 stop:2252 length:1992 start_codon:yes stop_codon:yes gene_type:complete